MLRDATFSEDGNLRFELVRDWRAEIGAPQKTALFAMLNPSKAGKVEDDPTVRKGIGFCRRWGFGRLVVVNLIPIVSTDPRKLPAFAGINLQNRAIIQYWMGVADLVVAAWGEQPSSISRRVSLKELVGLFCMIAPVHLHCIGRTAGGAPLHPSRAAYTEKPEMWREYWGN